MCFIFTFLYINVTFKLNFYATIKFPWNSLVLWLKVKFKCPIISNYLIIITNCMQPMEYILTIIDFTVF